MIDQALIHYWLTTVVGLLSRFGPRPSRRVDVSRRNFVKAFGMGAAGAAVVYSLPSIIVPQNIAVEPSIGVRGLPYVIANSGNYFDLSRSKYRIVAGTFLSVGGQPVRLERDVFIEC